MSANKFLDKNISGIIAVFSVGLFYATQLAIRVSVSNIAPMIAQDFNISVSHIGGLIAISSIIYALLQPVVGILADRFGKRALCITSLAILASSCLMMYLTKSIVVIYLARFLIGIGSAAGFVCFSLVAREWFAAKYMDLLLALNGIFSALLAMGFGIYSAYIVQHFGWRANILAISVPIFIALGLCLVFLKDRKKIEEKTEDFSFIEGFKEILLSRKIWAYGFVAYGLYASISIWADAWGAQYLMNVRKMNAVNAATCSSVTHMGMAIGGVLVSIIVQRWISKRKSLIYGAIISILLHSVVFFGNIDGANMYAYLAMLFAVGFFCSSEIVVFSMACDITKSKYHGLAIGFINGLSMIIIALVQFGMGWYIDINNLGVENSPNMVDNNYATKLNEVMIISLIFANVIAIICAL